MLLASISDIRDDLGFDDMYDINAAIEGALQSAEPLLEARLGTSFKPKEHLDVFWVKNPGFEDGLHCETKFRLRAGFITDGTLNISRNRKPVLNYSSVNIIDSCFVDMNKGVITDLGTRFQEEYVRVAYTSGFAADPSNPASYDLTKIPSWLKEAAKLAAFIALADNAALKEAGTNIDVPDLQSRLTLAVGTNVRYTPTALLPV